MFGQQCDLEEVVSGREKKMPIVRPVAPADIKLCFTSAYYEPLGLQM